MRRPPHTIYRLLGQDLLRLLSVTTIALVVVIAFAGAIKPLADGRLTLEQALLFMGLLTIPMIQFALPFAAGFSATLSYHRFAADNEAMACSAGGLGHTTQLTPALILGVTLTLVMSALSFEVIPPVLREAQRVLVTDGTRVLASQLNRGESVRLTFSGSDAIELYADRALPAEAPSPGSDLERMGASRIITLEGVLAVESRSEGDPLFASAERVFLFVFDGADESATRVQLVFENTTTNAAADGQEISGARSVIGPLRLPTDLADDPKFLTWGQMREGELRPRSMSKVDQEARVLAARLMERDALRAIRTALESEAGVTFVTDSGIEDRADETILLRAASMAYDPRVPAIDPDAENPERAQRRAQRDRTDRWTLAPTDDGRITVVRTAPDGRTLTHFAKSGAIELPLDRPGRDERVTGCTLILRDVLTIDGPPPSYFEPDGSDFASAELAYTGLLPQGFDRTTLSELPLTDLLEISADPRYANEALTQRVARVDRSLRARVDEQRLEIASKRHERLAFSVACCLMVLVGAGVGMVKRDSLQLPVYLWSFLPALGCVILISAGQRVMHREGAIGIPLLWGGVIALALLLARVYTKLRRH